MAHDYQTGLDDGLWKWAKLWEYMSSCDKEKALYLQQHKFYGHQIGQGSRLKAAKLKVVGNKLKEIKFMRP